jgi:hypothetical protein
MQKNGIAQPPIVDIEEDMKLEDRIEKLIEEGARITIEKTWTRQIEVEIKPHLATCKAYRGVKTHHFGDTVIDTFSRAEAEWRKKTGEKRIETGIIETEY